MAELWPVRLDVSTQLEANHPRHDLKLNRTSGVLCFASTCQVPTWSATDTSTWPVIAVRTAGWCRAWLSRFNLQAVVIWGSLRNIQPSSGSGRCTWVSKEVHDPCVALLAAEELLARAGVAVCEAPISLQVSSM